MIILYTSNGCVSCRKTKAWLKEHNIDFLEKNIFQVLLNPDEIRYLISRSEFGTDDIVSRKSKVIKENDIDIDSMSYNELVDFIVNNPSILKRPIILSDKEMQVGYNEEDITIFLRGRAVCDKENCSHYPSCGRLREDCE